GNKAKTTNHLAVHNVIQRAAMRVRALFGENFEVITMIGRAAFAGAITLSGRLRHELAKRALVAAGRARPVEAVFLTGVADNPLRVNAGTGAGAILIGIFVLRVDVSERRLYGVKFVTADSARQDLLSSGGGVELPSTILANQRDRERKIVRSDNQGCF